MEFKGKKVRSSGIYVMRAIRDYKTARERHHKRRIIVLNIGSATQTQMTVRMREHADVEKELTHAETVDDRNGATKRCYVKCTLTDTYKVSYMSKWENVVSDRCSLVMTMWTIKSCIS